jgi:ABC-type dipeptide/oligopeptide/nickel transport system ATPase component
LSLQDSSFGKQIVSDDILKRVNKALATQAEVGPEDTAFVEETMKKGIDEATGKRINVPEGSNPNNMVIFEDATTKYLMNDGQQEAYNFIKGTVERLLRDRKQIRVEDLENTQSFLDPLTQKFNGVIPKVMWDNMIGLAGRGGVGKTTVIRAIMDGLDSGNKYRRTNVMYLAPSHTAATVLQESLGLDSEKANDGTVNTIPSAVRRNQENKQSGGLDLMGEDEYMAGLKYKPAFSAPDIIIIDESSMVTTESIKDMLIRTKTDLANGYTTKMPIFIFMGDYRQLGPIGEQQNADVNKGIISSTLLLNKEKTRELTQVMRSNDGNLHQMYDAIGNEIIQNINLTRQGQKAKQLSFERYDKLTNKSSENILVVDNVVGVIDDYTEFLKDNNNPYGMFWVHYNRVENPTTVTLADKIRKTYFQKIGKTIEAASHRKFSNGDYVEFTNSLEIAASDFMYTPTDLAIKKLLDERKVDNIDGEYAIAGGMIKPRSRYKVMDIKQTEVNLRDILPGSISGFLNDPQTKVVVENILLYNRQNKLRGFSKALGVTVDFGKYNGRTKKQEGIVLKDKVSGKVLAKFDMFYGDFKGAQEYLKYLNDKGFIPFVPSYIGSSHTAQGNSIKNVIVGDYNIKQNRANPDINQDDIFSSMYVALTRTSGTLTIIKPQGANIVHNQEVFRGAVKDDGKSTTKPMSSIKPGATEVVTPQTAQVENYADNGTVDPLELIMRASADEVVQKWVSSMFKGETTISDFKGFMNRIFVNGNDFNKKVITAIIKSGVITPFKVVLDYKMADPGKYDPFTKTITINPNEAIGDSTDNDSIREKLHEVFMHELMHHLTADLLNAKPETLSAEQRKWVESLNNLFNYVKQRMLNDPNHKDALQRAIDQAKNEGYLSAADKSLYYGLTNVHDFVSMLMTDKGFQDFMNNVTYDGQKSFLEKFMEMIGDLLRTLGINVKDNSVLKEGVTNIIGLIQSRNKSDISSEQKSIATRESKEANINSNFENVIQFLKIKTRC